MRRSFSTVRQTLASTSPRLLSAIFACALLLSPASDVRADDPLADYRAKFEVGMGHFKSGDFAQAISYWQPIVKAIGDVKAYRLLYNLGVAYDQVGDATNAADRLKRFLREAAARKPDVPHEVLEFEADARARLSRLDTQYGRIRLRFEGGFAVAFQIDGAPRTDEIAEPIFYVVPGPHVVTFRPDTEAQDKRGVLAEAGQELEVVVHAAPPPTPQPSASVSAPAPIVSYVMLPPPPPAPVPKGPPFSAIWIGVAGGLTAASVAIPLLIRHDASGIADSYNDPTRTLPQRQADYADYQSDTHRYNLSWIVPGTLGAGTAALTLWYLLAPRDPEPVTTPQVGLARVPGGAALSISGSMR